MRNQPIWIDEDGEVIVQVRDNNFDNNMIDGNDANLMLTKLMEKLPKIAAKPIVVQHKQTIDEKFTLLVDEKPVHVITNADTNAHTTTSNNINNDARIESSVDAVAAAATDDDDAVEQSTDESNRNKSIIQKKKPLDVKSITSLIAIPSDESRGNDNSGGYNKWPKRNGLNDMEAISKKSRSG